MQRLDVYLTINEAAEFLGVSANTLRNWGRSQKVPMHRNPINGYRLFKRTDLESLLEQIARPEARKTTRKPR
jgi:excisionase family DNA binding protein